MSKQNSTKTPKSKARRVALIALFVLLGAAVIAGTAYFILFQQGKGKTQSNTGILTTITDEGGETLPDDGGKTVKYKGETYLLNEDIVTVLCIGTDNDTMIEDPDSFGENGQADALFLQTIDVKTGKAVAIGISRDSMADVDVYSKQGSFIRTDRKQICLAFAYGDGQKTSCDNVVKSVSRLFYGMPVKFYCAMDLEPIGLLNDAVGGVTVTALEDVRLTGGIVKKGETVKLMGEDARKYVQQRNTALLDSNLPRMKRQQQYLTAFSQSALRMTKKDITTPVKLFNRMSGYITTNLDTSVITYLTTSVLTNNYNGEIDFRMVQGKVVQGKKYAEFIIDETALYELILDVFYNKVTG